MCENTLTATPEGKCKQEEEPKRGSLEDKDKCTQKVKIPLNTENCITVCRVTGRDVFQRELRKRGPGKELSVTHRILVSSQWMCLVLNSYKYMKIFLCLKHFSFFKFFFCIYMTLGHS